VVARIDCIARSARFSWLLGMVSPLLASIKLAGMIRFQDVLLPPTPHRHAVAKCASSVRTKRRWLTRKTALAFFQN
jgi:hypothetical protein